MGCTSSKNAHDFYFTTRPPLAEEVETSYLFYISFLFIGWLDPFLSSAWATVLELLSIQVPDARRWMLRALWLSVLSILKYLHQQNLPASPHTCGSSLGGGSQP